MNWTLKTPTSFILVGVTTQQAHSCRGDIHFTGVGVRKSCRVFFEITNFCITYELAGIGVISPLFLLHALFILCLHTLGT